jgi:hypothetical protein
LQFSPSTTTIRITTSSATPTSPISTIIHKHDSSSTSSKDNNVVQSSTSSVVSSQIQNSSKTVDDEKISSWHIQSNASGTKMSNYQAGSPLVKCDGANESSNDANKATFNAMTKKRKAMHQANSSNRNSVDENPSK